MIEIRVVMSTLFTIVALSVTAFAHSATDDETLSAELKRIAQRRIFFGHQSVGMNLLDGINMLSIKAQVPIRVAEINAASGVETSTIGHTFIAENGNPLQKIKSFEHAMGLKSTGVDIALMKFCYVDFTAQTDVKALFASYRATMEVLKSRNPGTNFVHVTAPLTTVMGGFKEGLKRLLGRAPYGIMENMRREEYNTLLRQAYQGREPIFDLARIESTAPDGMAVTIQWKGSVVPVMHELYTDDGGHLSDAGKIRAARELVAVLAAIPDKAVFLRPVR